MPRVRYRKPPIAEAVIECFFEPTASWDESLVKRLVDALDPADRVRFERLDLQTLEVKIGSDLPPQLTTRPRYRCWNSEGSNLIQFGPEMISFNVLSNYSTIEDYLPKFRAVFELAITTFGFSKIQWVGQRYINQFNLLKDQKPEQVFAIYPQLPAQVRDRHPSFALQVETMKDSEKVIALNLENKGSMAETQTYTLDIYLRSLAYSSMSGMGLVEWMTSAHESSVTTFESALTAEAKLQFERI